VDYFKKKILHLWYNLLNNSKNMDLAQFTGFLIFLTIFTMGFWLMIFVITFVIPYWLWGNFVEKKLKKEAKLAATKEQ